MGTKAEVDDLDVHANVADGPEGIVVGLQQMLKDAKFKQAYAEGEAERLADELGKVLGAFYGMGRKHREATVNHAERVLAEYRDKWG